MVIVSTVALRLLSGDEAAEISQQRGFADSQVTPRPKVAAKQGRYLDVLIESGIPRKICC